MTPSEQGGWAAAALVAALVLTIPFFVRSFVDRRDHIATDSRAIRIMNVGTAEWIRDHTPRTAVVGVSDAGAIRYFGGRRTIDLLGLNYAPLAFGRTDLATVIAGVDWIAIFPPLFGSPLDSLTQRDFRVRRLISIPLVEYTVLEQPGQTQIVIASRTSPSAAETSPTRR